jgi:hypothetical protein
LSAAADRLGAHQLISDPDPVSGFWVRTAVPSLKKTSAVSMPVPVFWRCAELLA